MPRPSTSIPEDPAQVAASYALRLAQSCCHGCAAYHGTRPLFRALELAAFKGVDRQVEYFDAPLRSIAHGRERLRVLLPGSGDYAMFAVVSKLLEHRKALPCITVIDRCKTPLALTKWYAERYGLVVATEAVDVFDYAPREAFDAICADACLGFFRAAERPRLFGAWRRLLRSGGVAVIATRIRNVANDEEIRIAPHRRAEWLDRASRIAESLVQAIGVPRDEILTQIGRFADARSTYAVRSLDELSRQLGTAGFSIATVRQHDDGYVVVTAST